MALRYSSVVVSEWGLVSHLHSRLLVGCASINFFLLALHWRQLHRGWLDSAAIPLGSLCDGVAVLHASLSVHQVSLLVDPLLGSSISSVASSSSLQASFFTELRPLKIHDSEWQNEPLFIVFRVIRTTLLGSSRWPCKGLPGGHPGSLSAFYDISQLYQHYGKWLGIYQSSANNFNNHMHIIYNQHSSSYSPKI